VGQLFLLSVSFTLLLGDATAVIARSIANRFPIHHLTLALTARLRICPLIELQTVHSDHSVSLRVPNGILCLCVQNVSKRSSGLRRHETHVEPSLHVPLRHRSIHPLPVHRADLRSRRPQRQSDRCSSTQRHLSVVGGRDSSRSPLDGTAVSAGVDRRDPAGPVLVAAGRPNVPVDAQHHGRRGRHRLDVRRHSPGRPGGARRLVGASGTGICIRFTMHRLDYSNKL